MTIEIDQTVLDEVNSVINTKLVSYLNEAGCSFAAMAFIIQSLTAAVDEAQETLDEDENI